MQGESAALAGSDHGLAIKPEDDWEDIMKRRILSTLGLITVLAGSAAFAEKKYDTGANDMEIKIGQTMPYSGPNSAYGTIGRAEAAYFKMINDQG